MILAAALLGALGVQVARTFDFAAQPEEDAAILMRYARHLAAGHGIVWNVGEPPVDGATDFLFMLLLAGLHKGGLRLEAAVRALDLLAHALTVVVVYAGARRFFAASPLAALASAAFVAAGPALAYTAACFGTPLFALTVAVAWCAAAWAAREDGGSAAVAFAATALAMGLARPEGALLALFMLLAVLYARGAGASAPTLRAFGLVFGGLGLAYFAWRWWYFGHPFPTPFYKKGGGVLHWDTFRKSFKNVLDLTFPFVLAWPLGLAFSRTRRQAVFSLIPVVSFAAVWVLMSDETNYLKRFRYPIVPIVLMSWPPLLDGVRARLSRPALRVAAAVGLATACALLVRHHRAFAPPPRPRAGLQDMALMLRGFGGGRVAMAVTESGLLPFYSEWRAVDAWGLNDTWIARHGGVTEEYLERYRPEVVMFHAYYSPLEEPGPRAERSGLGPAWYRMCRTLQAYAERRGYRLAALFGREPSHVHAYYVRAGLPDAAALAAAIAGFDYVWYQDGRPATNFAPPIAAEIRVTSILKLPDVWRTLKEADLAAIRRDADRRFEVLVVSEDGAAAEALAELMTGVGRAHPWLTLATPDEARERIAAAGLDAAILVSGSEDLAPPLAAARDALRKAGVPLVAVVHGAASATSAVARPGETTRAAVRALDAAGLPPISEAVVAAFDPTLRLALARQLPPLRAAMFAELIDETARANATYALTTGLAEVVPVLDLPLNLADMVVLTKNQLVMSYKIALACGKKGEPRELIGEVMGVLGGGFLFRQAARQLVGLIPVAGIVPKVAMAYAGTWAVGRAVAAWASEGRRVTPAAVRRFYREAWDRGKSVARAMADQAKRARPKRSWFRRKKPPG